MNKDYLWDGSGEPDPEIQKLESALRRLRHNRPAPLFPEIVQSVTPERYFGLSAVLRPQWIAVAAACAAMVITLIGILLVRSKPVPVVPSDWTVIQMQGAPRLAGATMLQGSGSANLGVGQVLETDGASRASIRAEQTGEIEMEPGTRVRVLSRRSGAQHLELQRGTIHVTVWADPGKFVVDTPSAVAVDLGCVYTLTVDASGDGILHTKMGWVGFKLQDHESFIPSGAACVTRKKSGPGTPYFEDGAADFREALSRFDLAANSEERDAALRVVLSQSRRRDALTLWHLLTRVPSDDRERVYSRLNQLAPAPPGVTREGILRLEPHMLDLWWNALDLGDISLWRRWERSWSAETAGK